MSEQTALGLSSIVNRLVTVFPHISFTQLHSTTLQPFIELLTELTCSFLQSVAREEEVVKPCLVAVSHFSEITVTGAIHTNHTAEK